MHFFGQKEFRRFHEPKAFSFLSRQMLRFDIRIFEYG
jgi:hypothetical protein